MLRRELLRYSGFAGLATLPGVRAVESFAAAPATGTVFLSQLGYLPDGSKQATVAQTNGPRDFLVRSLVNNLVAYKGQLTPPSKDAASGDMTSVADFSGVRPPGTYRLELPGMTSEPFPIRRDGYAEALRLTIRSYYGQRCGCPVDLGGGYKHPACHLDGAYHPSSGKSGPFSNHGGWHDAGDYGRYAVNSGITTGTLLWAWELFPQPLRSLSLGIPESGGKLPDYLAEIRWNLQWMLSMQDGDGGVWHKQTSENFCGMIMPQDDKLTSYVIGTGSAPYKSTSATADLAAVMAIAARCYGSYDAAFAQRCLAAARQAWTWAIQHPEMAFKNPPGIGTGGYGDAHCGDEIAWASAELWRATGDPQYQKAFLSAVSAEGPTPKIAEPSWSDLLSMAYWTYALAERPGDAGLRNRILDATAKCAALLVDRSHQSGYGNTLALSDYGWGSNSVAANQSLLLLVADHFQPSSVLKQAAFNNLHYLLGRNCHGVSWVTQLGTRPFQHPHHRPSVADKIAAPWPGLLSGGPNTHGGDALADKLPKQPPMRMWLDDDRAYSLNEVAINWNAPLVFLLAAANS